MAAAIVKLFILFFLSLAAQAKPMFDCNNAFGNPKLDPTIDWSVKDGYRIRKVTMEKKDEDNSKSYAYCATALIEAEYVAKSSNKEVVSFSTKDIYESADLRSKDIAGALTFLKTHSIEPLFPRRSGSSSKWTITSPLIEDFCSQQYKMENMKPILMRKPACVQLTVPPNFLETNKAVNGKYDCSSITGKDIIKYDALLYGYDGDSYFVQTTHPNWGTNGNVKLQNAEKCGLNKQVSFIGLLVPSSQVLPKTIIFG